jgi:hypothetical protein
MVPTIPGITVILMSLSSAMTSQPLIRPLAGIRLSP